MGVVYAARDERLERTVAVKTMSALAQDDTARKRFWREARAAASVNHPNVCHIYEIGEHGGSCSSPWSSSKASRWPSASATAPERARDGADRLGILAALDACTRAGSSTATSSRRTSSSPRTASSCSTSGWPGPATPSWRARSAWPRS
jgi:hypothetical protein